MNTPEPRRTRNSGGEAETVTPQAGKSNNVTPNPRAGFLRRGDAAGNINTLHSALAAGPSVLLDDETGSSTNNNIYASAGGVVLEVSPQPSQLTQQLSTSQPQPGPTRLPRQRPRFHTVQDLDVALNQAIEGKINSRNAWDSKEASDLLEGITHTIETTLDAASSDDYSGFAKAATVVEGCSKVWTSRVDSTYQRSNQMVQRLLRKDDSAGKSSGEEREGNEGEEDGGDETLGSPRNKSRSRSAAVAAAATATRTLALDATEINLDSKSRTALTQTGVNAQFRAVTSKFDQGNAQGLLMNNAPIGRAGNIILGVDYSLLPSSVIATSHVNGKRGSVRRGIAVDKANTMATTATTTAEAECGTDPTTTVATRTSQHVAVEHDAAVYESVVDFPPYAGVTMMTATTVGEQLDSLLTSDSLGQPNSARVSLAFSQRNNNDAARASQASQLDPLLLLPHTSSSSPPGAELDDGHRPSSTVVKAEMNLFNVNGEEGNQVNGGAGGNANFEGEHYDYGNDGGGFDDDWADDGDGGDKDYNGVGNPLYTVENGSGFDPVVSTNRVASANGDLGLEARNIVSGITEMEAMDTLFHGHTQLALEAEDPTSWCPLSEVAKNPLVGGLGRSELSRLHREHRFIQSQKQTSGLADGTNNNTYNSTAAGAFLEPESPTSPAAKRGRKERTVVFQLPDSAGLKNGSVSIQPTFSTKADLLGDNALRQAATATRNITPLGKQLLFGKEAAHNVVAFTQSAVQRSKAEQAGLVLPEAPIPGKTIPSYMPYPIHTQDYFQPFSTSLTQWNLLRKSATGRLIDSSGTAGRSCNNNNATSAAGGIHGNFNNNSSNTVHRLVDCGVDDVGGAGFDHDDSTGNYGGGYREADMPVEFFPGGAEVEGLEGAAAGGDYADYADLYGPDDDHDDDDAEQRYVQDGFRSSADARLMAQVELAGAAASSVRSSAGSSSASSHNSNSATVEGLLADPMALLQVLSSPEAMMPNQVDVVRLRQLMWEALQGQLTANQQDTEADLAALRGQATTREGPASTQRDGGGSPVTANTAMKAHAQTVLDRLRKRTLVATEEEEKTEEKDKNSYESATERKKQQQQQQPAMPNPEVPTTSKPDTADITVTKFSDVVRSVLPHIASVSSTNTLSPAFFFFSILFLANEHNVVLQSVETLDDLHACGIARRVGG